MRPFLVTSFILLGAAYALPFQTPITGDYQCFSSEGIVDANAQDTGATLTINADGSYTFTTGSASENGSVEATEDTTAELELVFQNGSNLSLQPSSGSAAYEGMFLSDKYGGMYVFVFTNNTTLRCQSPGADIAAAIRQAAQGQTASTPETQTTLQPDTETTNVPATTETANTAGISVTPAESLTPLPTVESGIYGCSYTYENIMYYSEERLPYPLGNDLDDFNFIIFIYDDGTTLTLDEADYHPNQHAKGSYEFDAAKSTMFFKGGVLGGLTVFYGKNAAGQAALSYKEITPDNSEEVDEEFIDTYTCEYHKAIEPYVDFELAATTPSVDLMNITIAPIKTDPSTNPSEYPVPDMYYCYSIVDDLDYYVYGESPDTSGFSQTVREARLEVLPNFIYRLDGNEGQFNIKDGNTIKWLNGPLNPEADITTMGDYQEPYTSSFSFGEWGADVSSVDLIGGLYGDGNLTVKCFQQGAREQLLLLRTALYYHPQEGRYNCIDNESKQNVLELLPNERYRYNGEEGHYHYAMHPYGSEITWETGPLGVEAEYNASDTTGLRELTFTLVTSSGWGGSSSSELVMTCQAVVKSNLIPSYGTQAAPPAPAGSGGLDGFYGLREYDSDSNATWTLYHFLPDGYVVMGGYNADNQCSQTFPNGLPFCKNYRLQGNTIILSDGTTLSYTLSDTGLMLGSVFFENKALSGSRALSGTFESRYNQTTDNINLGTVSSSESNYTFSEDGSFSFFSSSQSSSGVFGIDASVYSDSSSSNSNSGTYSIDGNVITFNYAAGYSRKCTFFYPVNGEGSSVNICGADYALPSQ